MRRAARTSARRPKTVIALWLALVVACVALGSAAGTRALTSSASNVGQSAHAYDTLHRAGLVPAETEEILIRSASAHRTASATAALAMRARRLAVVSSVRTPAGTPSLATDGGRTALAVVRLRGDPDKADSHVTPLIRLVSTMRPQLHGVTVQETGDASVDHAISGLISRGLARAEMLSLPITLLILVLAFGALVAASVPLLLGITSVAAASGALGVVSHLLPESSSTSTVTLLVGLAVGVDYSLFAVRRWRTERRAGASPEQALDVTSATVGRAIVVAGATVIVGLAGLLFSGMAVFVSIALGAILVVAIAVLGSLTVLPATVSLLGDRLDRGRILGRRARRRRRGRTGAWGRLAAGVTSRPRTALAGALVALCALSVPALSLHTATDGVSALSDHVPAVRASQAVAHAFPGAADTATLVVTGHRLGDRPSRTALAQIGARGRALVGGHGPVGVRVSRSGTVAAVSIPVPNATLHEAAAGVQQLRATLEPMTALEVRGAHAQLTGGEAEAVDVTHQLARVTPLVIGFVLALAFVLLVLSFGSPWLALSVMGLNLLSVGAGFGALVAVFQHPWAQSLLGFTSNGAIVNWLPLFAFVLLFGLSMDYTVLVLERTAEARRRGFGAREAARQALAATGPTISSAALIMVAVFAVFATLPMLDFKEMGVGLSAAIALDATIVRGIALPAALTLLGDRGIRPARAARDDRSAEDATRTHATVGTASDAPGRGWEHGRHAAILETGHEG
ncbi:MAG TPA: MMPL family transporter [Solirubrobacteraceae bacterium]|nr:MMPL family transporter [Solirubrobacteraceae bacterium]